MMIYSKENIDREDLNKVEELKSKWNELEKDAAMKRDLLKKTLSVLFEEFLGKTYWIWLATEYDELFNGVSMMFIDKEGTIGGETVFFYVEVIEEKEHIERRMNEILQRNLKGGANLKYGLKWVFERGRKCLIKSPLENVVIFYLGLPEGLMYNAIKKLYDSSDVPVSEKPEFIYYVFSLLLFMIEHQIKMLSNAGQKPHLWLTQVVHGWLITAGMRKVEKTLGHFSGTLKKDGFLLNEHCETEMKLFEGKCDQEGREQYTAENIKGDEKIIFDRLSELGFERLVKLKAQDVPRRYSIMLLNKLLEKNFYAVGASLYDRLINWVDIYLISKDSGKCVAAFIVELEERVEPEKRKVIYKEKMEKVAERNREGGAYIKYAFKVIKENGKIHVTPSSQEHIPIFYIALPETLLYDAIKEMTIPEASSKSETILKFFKTTD